MSSLRLKIRNFLAAGMGGPIIEPKIRRAITINSFSAFGMFSMLFFFIDGLILQKYAYSIVLLGFILFLLFNIVFLQKTKNVLLTGHLIVIMMFFMELALLLKLGVGETGLLWYYLFPVLSFFILGRKQGSIYVSLLFVITIAYLLYQIGDFNKYDTTTIGRYIFTYLITTGMVYAFEIIRSQTYKTLVATNQQKTYYLNETMQQKEEILVQTEKLKITNLELEKLSIVASETTNAVKILDPEGNIEWINKGFERLYGYTINELSKEYNLKIQNLYHDVNLQALLNQCANAKKHCQLNFETKTKEGQTIWIQSSFTPIVNEEDQVLKIISIDTDISPLKEAEAAILQQNEEIRTQKEVLSEKNTQIELQHDMIKGSIRYAQKIQSTILPQPKVLESIFNWSVIYLPRDIVSGDFYWMTNVVDPVSKKVYTFIAVVDCTGHGVPGAFMSLIASRLLNEIINERLILETDLILTKLNHEVRKALKQDETNNNDGMDVVITRLEKLDDNEYQVLFSGAKRDLIYYNSKSNEINRLKADRKGIGGRSKNIDYKFTRKTLNLLSSDILYLFSDGITDQNNENRKRYGTDQLIEELNKIKTKTVGDQKLHIENTFKKYKGNEEQRDDICMLFLKLK